MIRCEAVDAFSQICRDNCQDPIRNPIAHPGKRNCTNSTQGHTYRTTVLPSPVGDGRVILYDHLTTLVWAGIPCLQDRHMNQVVGSVASPSRIISARYAINSYVHENTSRTVHMLPSLNFQMEVIAK